MNRKLNISVLIIFIFNLTISAQVNQFQFKRELNGITDKWHKVKLPDEIFAHLNPNFSDIRIYGITSRNDTVEVPYYISSTKEENTFNEVNFEILNQSSNHSGYYYTLKLPLPEKINEIKLNFKRVNFDWRVDIDGSHDQKEWYNLINDYRIISIQNQLTNYKFTKVNLPSSNYTYYRLRVNSDQTPKLTGAEVISKKYSDGYYRDYDIIQDSISINKKDKETVIHLELKNLVPVSYIQVHIPKAYEYYRNISIEGITDSINTENGWKYLYNTLFTGMVSSFESNQFRFGSRMVRKMRIKIFNNDNEPLTIDSINVKGFQYGLTARFLRDGQYFMCYGNKNAIKPNYDILQFKDQIPDTLKSITLGEESILTGNEFKKSHFEFINKKLLWIIITVIILTLGIFTVKMIRKG